MGIYIKGMDMPYGCANCSFCSSPVYGSDGYAEYFCNVNVEGIRGNNVTDEVLAMYESSRETFPEWCPLSEVPTPHGRLIDADELKKKVLMWLPSDPCGQEEKEFPFETDICVSMLMEIEEAPTIIEAEDDT